MFFIFFSVFIFYLLFVFLPNDSPYFSGYLTVFLLFMLFLLIFLLPLELFRATSSFIYLFLYFLELISKIFLMYFLIINFTKVKIFINNRTKLIKKAVHAKVIKIIKDTYSGSQDYIGDYGNNYLTVKYKSKWKKAT